MKFAEIRITKQNGSYENFITPEDYAIGIDNTIRYSENSFIDEWYFPRNFWRGILKKLKLLKQQKGGKDAE